MFEHILAHASYATTAALVGRLFDKIRIDHHAGRSLLSMVKDGQIKHHEIPLGVTFTSAEIAAWLCGQPLVIPGPDEVQVKELHAVAVAETSG
jgi:hypothetical protein